MIWATPGQRGFSSRQSSSTSSRSTATVSIPTPYTQVSGTASPIVTRPGASGSKQSAAQQEAIRKQQDNLRKAAELKQMLSNLEKVDDEGRRSSLLDTLCLNEDILNLPLHPNPPGLKNGNLQVDLLKHQVLSNFDHIVGSSLIYYTRAKPYNGA